jgi:hypothetical protein
VWVWKFGVILKIVCNFSKNDIYIENLVWFWKLDVNW